MIEENSQNRTDDLFIGGAIINEYVNRSSWDG